MGKIVSRINSPFMKNETHDQFNEDLKVVLVEYNAQHAGISPLLEGLSLSLINENEALDFIAKSEVTAKITEQDHVRDKVYRGFVDSIKGAINHFEPANREAAHLILDIVNHFGNIAKKTLDDETAAINDLVRELRQPETFQAIRILGFETWLDRLYQENDLFVQLMKKRYDELSHKTTFRMREARKETDKYYHAIVNYFENQHLAGDTTIEPFVKKMNVIIDRYKRILAKEISDRKDNNNNENENNI
jgi:hypothetical protein